MKKYFFAVIITLFLAINGFSLTFPFNIGLKAGINYSDLTGYTGYDNSISPGIETKTYILFSGGITMEYKLSDWVSFNVDGLVNLKGGKYQISPSGYPNYDPVIAKIRFDYVSVPAYLKVYTSDTLYILAGIEYSYLYKAKYRILNSKDKLLDEFDIDAMKQTNDWGYIIGLGTYLKSESSAGISQIELRYVSGKKSIFNDQYEPVKNRNYSVYFGVTYGIH